MKTETTQKSKVVSVKLDSTQQTKLEQMAAEQGVTVSEILRQKLNDTKAETVATLPPIAAGATAPTVATLDDATIINIAAIVAETVKSSQLSIIEVNTPTDTKIEREYLRKIAGLSFDETTTLSIEEETFLTNLKEAISAELREKWLLKENSVLMPQGETPLQQKMMLEMIAIRETLISEKLKSFSDVFNEALSNSFFKDAESLYNNMLFKATYGFEYKEFKAVFEL